jgi:ABC-type sugar transport system ATPase subunit
MIVKTKLKATSVKQLVINLSGGNQQKVAISKWLMLRPKIMIFDEPTRGIDVGAKYEIYCLLGELRAEGIAVVMISSELPEILGVSDRVLVLRQGQLAAEFNADEATPVSIMEKAT